MCAGPFACQKKIKDHFLLSGVLPFFCWSLVSWLILFCTPIPHFDLLQLFNIYITCTNKKKIVFVCSAIIIQLKLYLITVVLGEDSHMAIHFLKQVGLHYLLTSSLLFLMVAVSIYV